MLYTVSPAESLAARLAEWLLAEYGENPEVLARMVVFLPSRRAIRALREAFLQASSGKALLLPHLIATGDIDETVILRYGNPSPEVLQAVESLLPVPAAMERLLLLQELVWQHGQKMIPRLHDREAALDLAVNLADLMDEMDREQGDWSQLDNLVPEDFAEHWQQTLEFLKIIRDYWPQEERSRGWMRPWQKRNQLLELLAQCWRDNPPSMPVVAAGTTGSIPAVAQLLTVIQQLPKGAVVLPGFDKAIGEEPLPPTHPQLGMQELVLGMQATPEAVDELPGQSSEKNAARRQLMSLAMVPAEQLESWQNVNFTAQEAVQDLHCLEMNQGQELALATALLMRETLEVPEKTAAFITPDRQAARAVSAHLARWGVAVDDSAGKPLAQIPQAVFLQLLIEAVRYGLKPVSLLALLKHPLFAMGQSRAGIYDAIREVEQKALRGTVFPHWAKVKRKLKEKCPQHVTLFESLEEHVSPLLVRFADSKSYPFHALVEELLEVAETLTRDENGQCQLWQGDGSRELSRFFTELREAQIEQPITTEAMPGMLRALMRGEVVRPQYGTHPRLQILSPMEARLQRYDRVILADLNEGSWPQTPEADPWMNREMRGGLGLPSPDKRIGLQAHDFVQQAAGGEVFLMRTTKSGGAETEASRFLQRLEVLIEMAGGAEWKSHPVQGWVAALLHPEKLPSAERPAPKPPVETRPRELWVTSIERLMQDPYSIYARKILKLKKQEELDPDPSHREFGSLVHEVLERYFKGEGEMMHCAQQVFAREEMGYIADSLWWPRLERIATWVEAQPLPVSMQCEVEGEWRFNAPGGEFVLKARLDRLEESETGFSVIDYKTGAPMPAEWMRQGMANQLTLSAVTVKQGSFGGVLAAKPVEALEYWKLGGKEGGEKIAFATDKEESFEDVVARAYEALPKIIAAYDNDNKPYESIPEYRFAPRHNDYEHLARVKEWLD